MKVAVWDTYVTKKNGNTMHFDILVKEEETDLEKIFSFGKEYLKTKGQDESSLTTKECNFCHIDKASEEIESSINANGFYIIEMEGCE